MVSNYPNSGKNLKADLSLVRACASVQMEEAITVSAKVATHVTQYDGCRLTIIVVVTHGLWVGQEGINYVFMRCKSISNSGPLSKLFYISPSASADHLCPSNVQRRACLHDPGPARTVMPRPATAEGHYR